MSLTATKILLAVLAATLLGVSAGCTTVPSWAAVWPIVQADRTTHRTPTMRIDAIREFAMQATSADSEKQQELTDQLARQIQIEPDPLVRRAIVETIAEFQTPIAHQVLTAGLADGDPIVRVACCKALGERAQPASVEGLARALREDEDVDVRLAAADALGKIHVPEAIQALTVALDDRDPALQFVGVESMKAISGRDFGGDVSAWRQFAAGESPQVQQQEVSIADRLRTLSPF